MYKYNVRNIKDLYTDFIQVFYFQYFGNQILTKIQSKENFRVFFIIRHVCGNSTASLIFFIFYFLRNIFIELFVQRFFSNECSAWWYIMHHNTFSSDDTRKWYLYLSLYKEMYGCKYDRFPLFLYIYCKYQYTRTEILQAKLRSCLVPC